MCKIIAIANQKGGQSKSTTAVNLAVGLARNGKRVAVVDADPQGSCTASLGYKEPDELEITLATILGHIIDLSVIKYKNDPGSLAIKAFENAIKGPLIRPLISYSTGWMSGFLHSHLL